MNLMKNCLWLALSLLTAGCASTLTYRLADASVPPEQIVAVWIPVKLEPLTIDGRPTVRTMLAGNERYRYELAPGPHAISVQYAGLTEAPDQLESVQVVPVTVTVAGLAGHQYLLQYEENDPAIVWLDSPLRVAVTVADITTNTALIQAWSKRLRPERSPTAPVPGALVGLQQAWLQAGEAERGDFMKWTVTQAAPSAEGPAALHALQEAWRRAEATERGAFMQWTTQRP